MVSVKVSIYAFFVFTLKRFNIADYWSLYYPQVVFRICTVAGPEQKARAGGQKPQNGGSHKRTASRSRQNQSWGVTLNESCAFWNPPGDSERLFYVLTCVQMLEDSMKKEITCSKGSYNGLDLIRTASMRNITICLSAVWSVTYPITSFSRNLLISPRIKQIRPILRFSTSFAYYGLSMDLQKFGVSIYLIQVIFGAVDIPAKIVVTVCMSVLGRRPSQCGALVLAGVMILINLLVPYGENLSPLVNREH